MSARGLRRSLTDNRLLHRPVLLGLRLLLLRRLRLLRLLTCRSSSAEGGVPYCRTAFRAERCSLLHL